MKQSAFEKLSKKWNSLPGIYHILTYTVLFLLAFFIPKAIGSAYVFRVGSTMALYVMFGLSLNILVGYAGQMSLGHAAFAAIGAYTTVILSIQTGMNYLLASLLGGLSAALIGLLLGIPTLKLKDAYLMIATMGFSEIVKLIAIDWKAVTNGTLGIKNLPNVMVFGMKMTNANGGLYAVILAYTALTVYLCYAIRRSKFGRALNAIRGDELAASLMGMNTFVLKVIAFSIACFMAGYTGSLYSILVRYLDPKTFTSDMSTLMLCIVVLGGSGTIVGPIIGAIILIAVPEVLRSFADYRFLVYGLVLIIMMRFRPQGLIDNRRRSEFRLPKGVSFEGKEKEEN